MLTIRDCGVGYSIGYYPMLAMVSIDETSDADVAELATLSGQARASYELSCGRTVATSACDSVPFFEASSNLACPHALGSRERHAMALLADSAYAERMGCPRVVVEQPAFDDGRYTAYRAELAVFEAESVAAETLRAAAEAAELAMSEGLAAVAFASATKNLSTGLPS